MRIIALVTALFLSSAGSSGNPIQDEARNLLYKPAVGDSWKRTETIVGFLGGTQYRAKTTQTDKIAAVAPDGSYTVESIGGGGSVNFDGKVIEIEADDEPWTRRLNARGEIIEFEKDATREVYGDALLLGLHFAPVTPVKLGESWTPPMEELLNRQPLTFRFLAEEKIRTRPCLLIDGVGVGPDGVKIASSVWISADHYDMRRAIVKITEIPTEDGPNGELTITIETSESP